MGFLVFLGAWAMADQEKPESKIRPGTWLAAPCPKHLSAGPWMKIPGAQKTGWIPLIYEEGGARVLSKEEFAALGVSMEDFLKRAGEGSASVLAGLEPEVIRDERGVAQFALLSSIDHTAGTVLNAPELEKRFGSLFGDEIYVAVPSLDVVLVFPALAGPHEKFSERVLFAYKNSAYPASLELFSVKEGKVQAIGDYKEE
jgi:hypothetical protein